MKVPFNRPQATDVETQYLLDALQSGHLSGDGNYTKRVHSLLEQRFVDSRALLTHSCTAALEMAAILLEIGPGDEVIMPTFTFVSTANAVVLRGGVPVFVDIDATELNILPERIEAAITAKTKAVFIVHYAGVACDMDEIVAICSRNGLPLVEDAAQAYGSYYKGKALGTFGAFGTLSFHETKNLISGEGGALLINDLSYLDRAEIIREKGTDRSQFHRGEVDKYTWRDIGSSYLPSDLIAAFLLGQLERAEEISAERLSAWNEYSRRLSALAPDVFSLPAPQSSKQHNGHIFFLLTTTAEDRNSLLEFLRQRGIMAPFHYLPLHESPAGRRYGKSYGDMSTATDIAERLIRLPLYPGVCEVQDRIIQACVDWATVNQT